MIKELKKISNWAKRTISPVFIFMLLLSTGLWLLTKLSDNYTASVPVSVSVEGNDFEVECIVSGTGYRIFAHRYLKHKGLILSMNDVQLYPSVFNEGWYTISPHSLQNAVSQRNADISIISIGEIPEIRLQNNL